jgi:hypothetical protein
MNKPDETIKEVDKFNEWMLKIQNKYYSNHAAMTAAYQKIKNEKI